MPWSGGSFTRTNGVNTGATLWAQDRDDGTKILATRHDTNDQDMADGINSTLEKSGSNAATGNLDIGSNRITLVADGTAKTDVATVNQIQSNGPAFQATDTGTANTYVIALSPAITAYAAGQEITFKAGAASTTASTLNVNTLGAKALKKLHDQDIASGDIESGSIVTAVYDGTNFQVTSQLATEGGTPGGSDTQVQYNSSSAFAGSAHFTFDGTSATVANPLFLPDGSASAPALSNTGDTNTGIAFIAADTVGVVTGGTEQFRFGSNPIPGGNKNLVINGQCTVSQRGASFTGLGSGTSDEYTLDRWSLATLDTSTARWTVSQEASGGTSGKDPWLKCLNTTADASPGAGEGQLLQQKMEGYVAQPLLGSTDGYIDGFTVSVDMILYADGSSSISFPATISCVAYTIDTGRGCIINATITSAATWERVNFTFPADTSGTFNIDNTVGFRVGFGLYGGTSRDAAAGSWFSAALNAAVSEDAENIADATNNYLGFTNVQLEVGSIATSFAHEGIDTTLDKCYRYLWRRTRVSGTDSTLFSGKTSTTTVADFVATYPVPMRAAPTISVSATNDFGIRHANTQTVTTNITTAAVGPSSALILGTVSSGLTAGQGAILYLVSDDDYFQASAEL